MKHSERPSDIQYEGNALLRLLAYMKPHLSSFVICLLLVLVITALDLYRPTIIGQAIDQYITVGDDSPLTVESASQAFSAQAASMQPLLACCCCFYNRFQYLIMQQKTGQQISYDLRNTLFEHVQSSDHALL